MKWVGFVIHFISRINLSCCRPHSEWYSRCGDKVRDTIIAAHFTHKCSYGYILWDPKAILSLYKTFFCDDTGVGSVHILCGWIEDSDFKHYRLRGFSLFITSYDVARVKVWLDVKVNLAGNVHLSRERV